MPDLLFRHLLDTDHPVDLVFGQRTGPLVDASGRLDITLPPVVATFAGRLQVDNAVSRSDIITAGGGWQAGAAVVSCPTTARHRAALPVPVARTAQWQPALPMLARQRAAWRQCSPLRTHAAALWRETDPVPGVAAVSGWQSGRPTPRAASSGWQTGVAILAKAGSAWQTGIILRPSPRRVPWGAGLPTPCRVTSSASNAEALRVGLVRVRWQGAEHLPPGRSPGIDVPPQPGHGCYTPPAGLAVHLLFDEPAGKGLDILFSCGAKGPPSGAVVIPVLRYYIVINSASLTRVSNNLPLPVTGLSLSIDADSAHWTWSATVPLRSLADLEPDAPGELVELEAMVNGFPWRLLVERKGEKERFGSASLSIGGRGIAAELSDPTYPIVSHDNVVGAMTAQQLAAAALSINGVPLGWSLDWQAADWLVPAGAWVHSGTPLDAVVRIAAAAGAYVQAAPGSRALRVVPRYPVAPWAWSSATPALVLPASAVMERGTDHVNRAAYNVVYVSGQAGGVLARVKRAGSAGDRAAQMIVDGLTTHADAARGRGLEVLGNTGAQQIVSLETGILPASGVIHVGTLMDWTRGTDSRRGLVRSLSVTASVPTGASKDPVKVRQTIGVEIHG